MTSGLNQASLLIDPPKNVTIWDEKNATLTPLWAEWFRQVTRQLNRTAPRPAQSLTVTAGAFVWKSDIAGDVRVFISGGTVTTVLISVDGSVYYPTGVVSGQVTLSQGMSIQINNTVAPTVTAIPA